MFVPNSFINTINHTYRRRVIGRIFTAKAKEEDITGKARPKPEWKSGMDSGDVEENYGSSLGGAKGLTRSGPCLSFCPHLQPFCPHSLLFNHLVPAAPSPHGRTSF